MATLILMQLVGMMGMPPVAKADEVAANITAQTAPSIATRISIVRDANTLWLTTALESTNGETLTVQIYAPTRHSNHRLWQRCEFPLSGGGTYRCGIDVGGGRPAPRGHWIASADIDGEVFTSRKFRVRGA